MTTTSRVWHCDEMRFGLWGQVRRRWGLKGKKIIQPMQIVYRWSYLVLAVDVLRGELHWGWSQRMNQYLLRGLIRCSRCGGSYTGHAQHGYRGYRCTRANWTVSSTGQRCSPGSIPAQSVEEAVWEAVKKALQNPQVLAEEYNRQIETSGATGDLDYEIKRLNLALKQLKTQEDRVTEAYLAEAMDLPRCKSEMERLSAQRQVLEQQIGQVQHQTQREANHNQALTQLDTFCSRVGQGLDYMTFEERQQFLRLVVESVTVAEGRITVEAVIPSTSDGKLRNVRGEPVEP